MGPEDQDRGDGFDDLFEELDDFFAAGPEGDRKRRRERAAEEGERPEESENTAAAPPGAEDLLPPGWKPDIEGLDMAAPQEPEPAPAPPTKRRGRRGRAPEPSPPAEESTGELVTGIQTAQHTAIPINPGKDETVQDWLAARGFTKVQAKASVEAAQAEQGGARTVWDIVNGITAYARTLANADERVALESKAGKLMEAVAS